MTIQQQLLILPPVPFSNHIHLRNPPKPEAPGNYHIRWQAPDFPFQKCQLWTWRKCPGSGHLNSPHLLLWSRAGWCRNPERDGHHHTALHPIAEGTLPLQQSSSSQIHRFMISCSVPELTQPRVPFHRLTTATNVIEISIHFQSLPCADKKHKTS